jgi:hypothetical protein
MLHHPDSTISAATRNRRLYLVEATRTVKTTLMKKIILEDLQREKGLFLLHTHDPCLGLLVHHQTPKSEYSDDFPYKNEVGVE